MMTDYTSANRSNDQGSAAQERSERFFTQHNYWYFSTREGMDIGPFATMMEAAQGVQGFIEFLGEAEPEVVNRITEYVTQTKAA